MHFTILKYSQITGHVVFDAFMLKYKRLNCSEFEKKAKFQNDYQGEMHYICVIGCNSNINQNIKIPLNRVV